MEAWLSSQGKGGCWQEAHAARSACLLPAWPSVTAQKHPALFSSLSFCEHGAHAWEDIGADKGSCVCNVGKFIIILGLAALSITDC